MRLVARARPCYPLPERKRHRGQAHGERPENSRRARRVPRAGRQRSRKSSIKGLPPDLCKKIDKLPADGRHTIDQIVAHERFLGADVSRSSVGHHSKQYDAVAAKMRESREIAALSARELDKVPEDGIG